MPHSTWPIGVRGAVYFREIGPRRSTARGAVTVMLLSHRTCPSTEALHHTMHTALREKGSMCLLHLIPKLPSERGSGDHRNWFEIGELLTAAVLRVADGRTLPHATVIVFVGTRSEMLDFLATTVQPALVIAGQGSEDEEPSALPETVGRSQQCPVLLVPSRERLN